MRGWRQHRRLQETPNCLLVLSSRASAFTRCMLNEADGRQAGSPSFVIGVRAANKPECFYLPRTWLHVKPVDTNTWRAEKANPLGHLWIGYLHFVTSIAKPSFRSAFRTCSTAGSWLGHPLKYRTSTFTLILSLVPIPTPGEWDIGHCKSS
jgi:hypothetical protein